MNIEMQVAEIAEHQRVMRQASKDRLAQLAREKDFKLIRISKDIQVYLPKRKQTPEYIKELKKRYGIIKD